MKVKSQEQRVESQTAMVALRWGSRRSALDSPLLALDSRRGLTLIELLVVIIIVTTVVAAAIPILAPAGTDRANREATRSLNTFITGAQTRATALRRPFGIALKRLSQDTGRAEDNGVCLEAYYVEQQTPYSGFEPNSRARVTIHDTAPQYVIIQFVTRGVQVDNLPRGWDADLFPGVTKQADVGGVIRPGDVLEMGGTYYELLRTPTLVPVELDGSNTFFASFTGMTGNTPVQIVGRPLNNTGQQIVPKHFDNGAEIGSGPPPANLRKLYWTAPMPYKIFRQPIKTSDPPYQMPEGVAIDLRASGYGRDDFFYVPGVRDNADNVLVMFTPEGRVDRLHFNAGTTASPQLFDEAVVDNVFLMLGKRENVPAPETSDDVTLSATKWAQLTTDEQRQEARAPVNWLNGDSRWIVIGSQSGRVVSIENAFVNPGGINTNVGNLDQLRNKQILAARQYTTEMANVGGR